MLDGAGFPITKLHEPVGIPPAPEYLKLTPGDTPGVMYIDIGIVNPKKENNVPSLLLDCI